LNGNSAFSLACFEAQRWWARVDDGAATRTTDGDGKAPDGSATPWERGGVRVGFPSRERASSARDGAMEPFHTKGDQAEPRPTFADRRRPPRVFPRKAIAV
jgi:hypothetical protein